MQEVKHVYLTYLLTQVGKSHVSTVNDYIPRGVITNLMPKTYLPFQCLHNTRDEIVTSLWSSLKAVLQTFLSNLLSIYAESSFGHTLNMIWDSYLPRHHWAGKRSKVYLCGSAQNMEFKLRWTTQSNQHTISTDQGQTMYNVPKEAQISHTNPLKIESMIPTALDRPTGTNCTIKINSTPLSLGTPSSQLQLILGSYYHQEQRIIIQVCYTFSLIRLYMPVFASYSCVHSSWWTKL